MADGEVGIIPFLFSCIDFLLACSLSATLCNKCLEGWVVLSKTFYKRVIRRDTNKRSTKNGVWACCKDIDNLLSLNKRKMDKGTIRSTDPIDLHVFDLFW